MAEYDVIVVGLGAMGGAAAYQLASRGQRVLGLDAFPAGHTFGSSHGETRVIRMAYYEHPNYVPLLRRAYELWEHTQVAARTELLRVSGGVFIGASDGALVSGSLKSAQLHGLPHTLLDGPEIRKRFPALHARDDEMALYEDQAGVLFPERCIQAHLDLAEAAGARLEHAQPVRHWRVEATEAVVETDIGRYSAAKLIVTAGAWAGKLLSDLGLPLKPERVPIYWFEPLRNPAQFDLGRMPIWMWDDPAHGMFYALPHVQWPGVKIGKHHSGEYVDPDNVDRELRDADERPVRAFLEQRVPDVAGPVADGRVCLYTNTPDEHFIVDIHPQLPNVVYAAGFSGHGFKFATVIGEILADLATTGQATPHADFLRAARLSDPKTGVFAAR